MGPWAASSLLSLENVPRAKVYTARARKVTSTPHCIVVWFIQKENALEYLATLWKCCGDTNYVRKIYYMVGEPINPVAEVTTHQLRSGNSLAPFTWAWQPSASTAQAWQPHMSSNLSHAWQPPCCSSAHGLPGLDYHHPREGCIMPCCTVQTYCKGQLQVLACLWIHFSCSATVTFLLMHLHCHCFLLMPN